MRIEVVVTLGGMFVTIASLTGAVESPSLRHVEVRVEVSADPSAAGNAKPCTAVAELEAGVPAKWWSKVGAARPSAKGGWEVTGMEAQCGAGTPNDAKVSSPGREGVPYLIVDFTTTAVTRPGPRPFVQMSLTLSTQKLSELSPDGTPSYASRSEMRIVRLDRPDEMVLPVFVPSADETKLFGMRQALLRMRARPATRPPATDYGTISVSTDAPGTEVLLDGGVVGRTDGQGNLILRNVSAGDRDLGLRDGAHRFVRVLADQTVGVAIGLSSRHSSSPAKELVPLGPNDRGYDEYRRGRDGAVMVKVPEGEFLMGNLDTEGRPLPHTVYVSTFLMDKTPVTWGQFRKFGEETGWPWPPEPYWGFHDDLPAAYVTWEEARAYCEWAGGRLPTEAEREKAARGTDGRKFPWGNEEPTPERAVFRHNWGYEASEPVGTHPSGASPYGVLDVGGNMWEWCEDWYDEKYYESSPARNPKGPPSGRSHVVRGGSWDSRPTVLSASCRNFGDLGYREGDFGFRCAAEPTR